VLVFLTLRAFGEANGIWGRFRRAADDQARAKADLATGDRRKALGYVLLVGALVCLAALIAFVYHSWQGPKPPSGFRGR
jgi:ferric-dicitrate binding protein FerR (iron transport regulator)